jgi:hypothetical protein
VFLPAAESMVYRFGLGQLPRHKKNHNLPPASLLGTGRDRRSCDKHHSPSQRNSQSIRRNVRCRRHRHMASLHDPLIFISANIATGGILRIGARFTTLIGLQ